MNYLTLDTNTWIYLANGTEPVRLLHYIKEEVDKRNITIILPSIIIDEWNKNKDYAVKQGIMSHFKDITKAMDRLLRVLGEKGERDLMGFILGEKDDKKYFQDIIENFTKKREEIEEAISDNIKLIETLFKHKSTKIIEINEPLILKAGQFALLNKAPFRNKNSFADALIFFSFIDFVKTHSIEGAFFITYNTKDFCEKKNHKKYLHPDLESEFLATKSKFFTIVGEALNTIENDIITQEELAIIKELQDEPEYDRDVVFCSVCEEMNDRLNEVSFSRRKRELIDERIGFEYQDPDQLEIEFAKKTKNISPRKYFSSIEVGYCDYCSTEHFKCVDCGFVNTIWDHEYNKRKECEECGMSYLISRKQDREGFGEVIYRIIDDIITCEKCGNEFENEGTGNNLCKKCEDEYVSDI